jgi:hypothetical protein
MNGLTGYETFMLVTQVSTWLLVLIVMWRQGG